MLHARGVFAMLCSACACVGLQTLDLIRDTTMVANKPPFPTVNIIADHPIREVSKAFPLQRVHGEQQSVLQTHRHAHKRFEAASIAHLEAQHRQLDDLRRMNAHISVAALDAKQAHI